VQPVRQLSDAVPTGGVSGRRHDCECRNVCAMGQVYLDSGIGTLGTDRYNILVQLFAQLTGASVVAAGA
jgi:hypothetical protein